MGNVGGREVDEGSSAEVDTQQFYSDPMLHSPPHTPNDTYHLPFLFPPQIPMFPWLRSAEMIQAQNDVLEQNTIRYEDLHSENNLPWEYNGSARALNSQISEAPLPGPSQMMQVRDDPLVQNAMHYKDFHHEEKRAVMITWCFGGNQVAVTGSWDDWKTMYWKSLI